MADGPKVVDADALEVAQLIEQTLVAGFLTHHAAITIAKDVRAAELAPAVELGMSVPIGRIPHRDETGWTYHFLHYLDLARNDPAIALEMERVWVYGALLVAGDALAQHAYFDRAPVLELVRHLRNGIAHGNQFRIDRPDRLARWPANNSAGQGDGRWRLIEVTPSSNHGAVLFDFIEAGEAISVLQLAQMHLRNLAFDQQVFPLLP